MPRSVDLRGGFRRTAIRIGTAAFAASTCWAQFDALQDVPYGKAGFGLSAVMAFRPVGAAWELRAPVVTLAANPVNEILIATSLLSRVGALSSWFGGSHTLEPRVRVDGPHWVGMQISYTVSNTTVACRPTYEGFFKFPRWLLSVQAGPVVRTGPIRAGWFTGVGGLLPLAAGRLAVTLEGTADLDAHPAGTLFRWEADAGITASLAPAPDPDGLQLRAGASAVGTATGLPSAGVTAEIRAFFASGGAKQVPKD